MHKGFTNAAIPALSVCESPIEGKLIQAMFDMFPQCEPVHTCEEFKARLWLSFRLPDDCQFNVALQATFSELTHHRYDLVVFPVFGGWFAVEIDGKDYHSSADRFQADRSLDRRSLALGIPVVRFTGSEVFRDPEGAVNCILELCESRDREEISMWQRASSPPSRESSAQ